MNRYHLLSIILFVTGIIFFALGILSGEVKMGFVVFFPFLIGTGVYALLGFIFFFISILLFMFGFIGSYSLKSLESPAFYDKEGSNVETKSSVKGGGVIFIGPIPIVFGSNWKIAIIMMILAFVLMLTIFLLLNP